MQPDPSLKTQTPVFWSYVRTISQAVGYSSKGTIVVPTVQEMADALSRRGLDGSVLADSGTCPSGTEFAQHLAAYFRYRADVLEKVVKPNLMDADEASAVFEEIRQRLNPSCPIPMNKQRGEKRTPAYLTGLVNMLIEKRSEGFACDYDPHESTTFTDRGRILRTLARRVDGAFPSAVNPVAIWEIKEYYHTTSFGSRVAGGVYETLLDGMELAEMHAGECRPALHYLFVDGLRTWWKDGKSYLCRLVDILNMGYVDEILVGREVLTRLPELVPQWVQAVRQRMGRG